jgi:hypothetical protein
MKAQREIVLEAVEAEPLALQDIANKVGMKRENARWHLTLLAAEGLVHEDKGTPRLYWLADASPDIDRHPPIQIRKPPGQWRMDHAIPRRSVFEVAA